MSCSKNCCITIFSAIKLTRTSRVGQACDSERLRTIAPPSQAVSLRSEYVGIVSITFGQRETSDRGTVGQSGSFKFTKSKAREIVEPLESLEEGMVKA